MVAMPKGRFYLLAAALVAVASIARADVDVTWHSPTLGRTIGGTFLQTTLANAATQPAKTPLVIVLTNTKVPRLGTEPGDAIVRDLRSDGNAVLVLDYEGDAKSTAVALAEDVLKLRTDLASQKKQPPLLLADQGVDENRAFILPDGYRLARDVEFYADDKRSWKLDVAYPATPATAVPLVFEITCDNSQRMGNASLLFCRDTLVEGALLNGFAAAMIDHPVSPPYKGLDDPAPRVWQIAKAAPRAIRAHAGEWSLNGKLGAMGFSRGGPFAAMLALSNGNAEFEGDGPNKDRSSDVQGALAHGNRYDYLDLLPNDPMLARFAKAWGERDASGERWAEHGATHFAGDRIAPMFLNTSDAESPEYRDGIAKLDKFLVGRKVDHVFQIDADGRGHKVSTDPKTLASIYAFFHKHLD